MQTVFREDREVIGVDSEPVHFILGLDKDVDADHHMAE